MNKKKWYVGKDAIMIKKILDKYRGTKDNPLNGKTFKEILAMAKKEEIDA